MTLRERYNRDGYVVQKLWNPSDIDIFDDTDDLFLRLRGMIEHDEELYINYLKNVLAKGIGPLKMLLDDSVIDTIKSLGISRPILSSYPSMHVIAPELKLPGYYGTEAHQDWPSVQGSLDMITVWIPLTDTIGNFPLEVIKGSHLKGFIDGKQGNNVLEVECDERDFSRVECRMGEVIFLSGFLIHRTAKTGTFRIAVSQRFDNFSEPTFVERGFPCAQKRTVDRVMKWKPTMRQVRSIYA